MFPSFFEHFITFWNAEIFQNQLVLSFPQPWNQIFLQGSFYWRHQDLSHDELTSTRVLLLLGPFSEQSLGIYKVCSRMHTYSSCRHLFTYHHDLMLIPLIPAKLCKFLLVFLLFSFVTLFSNSGKPSSHDPQYIYFCLFNPGIYINSFRIASPYPCEKI